MKPSARIIWTIVALEITSLTAADLDFNGLTKSNPSISHQPSRRVSPVR